MSDPFQTAQSLPWPEIVSIALMIVVGLMLWVIGRRVLRASFALMGLLMGLGGGWLLALQINLEAPAWIVAVVSGLLLACVGALAYRTFLAGALAMVLGLTLPIGVRAMLGAGSGIPGEAIASVEGGGTFNGQPIDDVPNTFNGVTLERATEQPEADLGVLGRSLPLESLGGLEGTALDGIIDQLQGVEGLDTLGGVGNGAAALSPETRAVLDRARTGGLKVIDRISQFWASTPEKMRPTLLVSALIGVVLGVMLGTITPGVSASIVTSFGGAGLWLNGGRLLAVEFDLGDAAWMPTRTLTWAGVWLTAAIIGLAIQWMVRPKRADKSA